MHGAVFDCASAINSLCTMYIILYNLCGSIQSTCVTIMDIGNADGHMLNNIMSENSGYGWWLKWYVPEVENRAWPS